MELVLAKGWIYAGKRYGPGAIDPSTIPPEAAEALFHKGAFGDPEQLMRAQGVRTETTGSRSEVEVTTTGAAESGTTTDPIAEAVGATEAQALRDMGFDSPAKILAASDENLTAVPGIGEAKLKRLRALGEG